MKNKMKTPYLMGTLRFILFLLIILGFCISYAFYGKSIWASDVADSDKNLAVSMTKDIINNTFSFVLNPKNSISQKIELLKANLISKVDFNFVSPFVLGPINRTMELKDKDTFKNLFSDLMLYSYTNKFSSYKDYVAKVTNTEDVSDKGQLYVNFIVYKKDNKDTTKIDCKVRLRKTGDTFKIVDINVAGVSMAVTYRGEFKAVIDSAKSDGKDVVKTLINMLTNKVNLLKNNHG